MQQTGVLRLLLRQFESPLALILVFAAVVALVRQQGVLLWSTVAVAAATLIGPFPGAISTAFGFVPLSRGRNGSHHCNRRRLYRCNRNRKGPVLSSKNPGQDGPVGGQRILTCIKFTRQIPWQCANAGPVTAYKGPAPD